MNEAAVVLVRSVISFGSLLIFARMLGKQQVSQITFFDYILGITIGSIAANLTTDLTSRSWTHWVGLAAWALMVFFLQKVTLKWRKASIYLDEEPVIVIMNGKIMEDVMHKLRYQISDLQEQLREAGTFDINEVEYAILERDGKLSVLKKSQYLPVTAEDLKITTPYKGLGTELIYDGEVVEQNLTFVNHDRHWLDNQLQAFGYQSPSQVFLAVLAPTGDLFIDGYRDNLKKYVDISDYNGLR
ncbi:DUF421 domain-containing protein [Niallia endozanthoxylica]|uniref:DUF421 domain-containing protein n=1 Tax=Niallia endozanthoxylica TaxID=2036016 RepID=A0A5J5GXB9_9BACI|nr:DUF421 domain-containing protein [Niallia endozanthoxylica]KAA9012228.1 DUF421 domain-containing protein [Niallia endozanthoxylica]